MLLPGCCSLLLTAMPPRRGSTATPQRRGSAAPNLWQQKLELDADAPVIRGDRRRSGIGGPAAIKQVAAINPLLLMMQSEDTPTRVEGLKQFAVLPHEAQVEYAPAIAEKLCVPSPALRCAALEALSCLPAPDRANVAATVMPKIEHADPGVRHAVLWMLGKLPVETRSRHAAALHTALANADPGVRHTALEGLGTLPQEEYAKHCAAVVAALDDPDPSVRCGALWGLGRMPLHPHPEARESEMGNALAPNATAVVKRLEDEDAWVRSVALEVLAKLPSDVTPLHAEAMAALLVHERPEVSSSALRALAQQPSGVLAAHASAIEQHCVAHGMVEVRRAAVETLGMLEPTPLAEHAGSVTSLVADDDAGVRAAALAVLRRLPDPDLAKQVRRSARRCRLPMPPPPPPPLSPPPPHLSLFFSARAACTHASYSYLSGSRTPPT